MTGGDGTLEGFGKSFPKGTILFREGDSTKEIYLVHSGRVKITKQVRDSEKTLAVFGPGDFFGEMAFLLDKPRSATAEVMEDSILIVIEPQTFESMIHSNAGFALKIIKKFAARIWDANEKIESLMLRDSMGRVVNILTRMAETSGIAEGDAVRINITPKELANEADIDVATVKDLIEKLSQTNIITLEEKAIKVNGIHKLKFFNILAVKKESEKI